MYFHIFAGAASCTGLKSAGIAKSDGEYLIYQRPECTIPIKVYCHGLNTSQPKEYLTLPAGGDDNYAFIYAKRLLRRPYSARYKCSGPTGELDYSSAGKTKFRKLRIDLTTMRVIRDDFTFSKSDPSGKQIPYGTGGDCFSMHYGPCRRGHFKVNLSGTGLRLRAAVEWKAIGFPPGIEMQDYKKSKDGTQVTAKCGGWCAQCLPGGDMLLEQTVCDVRGTYVAQACCQISFRVVVVVVVVVVFSCCCLLG